MDFMMWATRSIHVFSAVIWVGGLLYMGGVLYPVYRHEKMTVSAQYVRIEMRFLGFVWMCVWTTAITGIFLMIFSPRYVFGQYRVGWDYLLLFKQLVFLIMVAVAMSGTKIVKRMETVVQSAQPDELEKRLLALHQKMLKRRRLNLVLGIVMILISTSLVAR